MNIKFIGQSFILLLQVMHITQRNLSIYLVVFLGFLRFQEVGSKVMNLLKDYYVHIYGQMFSRMIILVYIPSTVAKSYHHPSLDRHEAVFHSIQCGVLSEPRISTLSLTIIG